MTVGITIQVPNTLGKQLQPFRERLPEILERGLHEMLAEKPGKFHDESTIIELGADTPGYQRGILSVMPTSCVSFHQRRGQTAQFPLIWGEFPQIIRVNHVAGRLFP